MSLAKPKNAHYQTHFNVNNQSSGKLPSPPRSPRISKLNDDREVGKKEKKIQPPAPEESRCLARVATGEQCKRSRNENTDLCTCHSKNLPYGKINGPLEGKFLNLPKKRGPRFRNQSSFSLNVENQHHYVATQLIKIDDELYLIDELGLLYSNDKRGEIVGRRLMNEIHWYGS